jgi:hypothetical protein
VDFVICDPKTMVPQFALELDDSSHNRPDREERDAFVDQVFAAAELPLLHIPVRAGYNTAELSVLFKGAMQKSKTKETPAMSVTPSTGPATASPASKIPLCPKCGVPMVLRTAKNGAQAGKPFYGCPNYPKCRVVLPVAVDK